MRTRRDTAVTAALIVVNAGVFFLMMLFYGDPDLSVMVKCGAMYGPYVRERQEYYRLFASMFLHFDFYHLMNNMVMLGALGVHLEPELGSVRMLAVYLAGGLGGNLLSFFLHAGAEGQVVSAGASGAVFGLMGALLWMVIRNRGSFGRIRGQRIFLMIGLSLYFGFTSTGVDNYAHVGGLVCGFLTAMFLYRPGVRKAESW